MSAPAPRPTLTLAIPASTLPPHTTLDQHTLLAGTLARAATLLRATELVVYNDAAPPAPATSFTRAAPAPTPQDILVHLLSYVETPPHLRRALFPLHRNLRSAGLLPALDIASHVRAEARAGVYREGVALRREGEETVVECGVGAEVRVSGGVPEGCRVTVRLLGGGRGEAVRAAEGVYWGFAVRAAAGLREVFTECPYEGGYSVSVACVAGAEPVGRWVERVRAGGVGGHLLVGFEGREGWRAVMGRDEVLRAVEVGGLFDVCVDPAPGRGGSGVRVEEAVWLAGARLVDLFADGADA